MRSLRYATVFVIGAAGYFAIELLWRGRSHWTMAVTGGICFLIIYFLSHLDFMPLAYKCAAGAFAITAVEFAVGCVVNLLLGWRVWDYSALEFNIMGQVCLLFSIIWYFITIPALYLCKMLDEKLFVHYTNGDLYEILSKRLGNRR